MVAAVSPVPVLEAVPAATARIATPEKPAAAAAELAPRLVIEEDPGSGQFVYKMLDRDTGEVIRQLPREEVLQLRRDPDYRPGDVASTSA